MVQLSSETAKDEPSWRIHFTKHREDGDVEHDAITWFHNTIQIARNNSLELPSWLSNDLPQPQDIVDTSQRAIDVYMLSKKPDGGMSGVGWWQAANGYTAMALHDLWSPGYPQNYSELCSIIYRCEQRQPGLINVFNDDTLWWAMLCMHMYAIKRDYWFYQKAKAIWKHVSGSVIQRGEVFFNGADMEGAVYWTTRSGEEQINSISTGLYAELSIRLALVHLDRNEEPKIRVHPDEVETSSKDYIEAAQRSLSWILHHRFRSKEGIVLDHIKLKQKKAVDWIFTYNTGVALGVCALIYEATGEEDYMELACHMAFKAMTRTGPKGWVEDNGVLTEKLAYGRGTHDPRKNNDAVGFKAVLVRQLCTFYSVAMRTACPLPHARIVVGMISKFINRNCRSQLERNTDGSGSYGPWWNGPFEYATPHSQMAVLDVMAAAVLVADDLATPRTGNHTDCNGT